MRRTEESSKIYVFVGQIAYCVTFKMYSIKVELVIKK